MGGQASAVRAASGVGAALLIVGVATAGMVAALLAAAAGVVDGWTSSPYPVVTCLAAAISAACGAYLLGWRGIRLGVGLLAVAAALAVYLATTSAAVWIVAVGRESGPFADWVTALGSAGYQLPMTALAIVLVRRRRADVRTGWQVAIVIGLAAGNILTGAVVAAPPPGFEAAAPPFAGLVGPHPAWEVAFAASSLLWMVAIAVFPLLLWRDVPRARGVQRMRTAIAATAAIVAPWTLLMYSALDLLLLAENIDANLAADVLSVVFALPAPVVAVALTWAHAASNGSIRRRSTRVVEVGIAAATLAPLLTAAAFLGIFVGGFTGLAPLLVAVVVTALATTGLAAARRWWTIRLLRLLDPARSRAAALQAARSPQDRLDAPGGIDRVLTAVFDATVQLVIRLPGTTDWVDALDAEHPPPGADAPALTGADGDSIAYLIGEVDADDARSALEELREPIGEAVLAIAMLDRDRRIAQERRARTAAAREERRRLERDLHDGVQGRLVALALELRVAETSERDPVTRLLLGDTVESLLAINEELRSLAGGRGSHLVTDRGLDAALSDIARSSPIPITLSLSARRWEPEIETMGYLIVCEAIANALKHARANSIEVEVRDERGTARFIVRDDGIGGADPGAGTGIRGLAERVAARGGRLEVRPREPRGTILEAEVPCAS